MAIRVKFLPAAAAIGALAAPAVAQYYPPQQTYPGQTYPGQTYPGQAYPQQAYPPQTYPQQANPYGYGYDQGYPGTTGNPVTDVIDQLLGNRYSVTDRQAIHRCADAARAQAVQKYGGYGGGYGGHNNGYGYGANGYGNGYAANLHVTSISNVERRSDGLRVTGTLCAGGRYGGLYGNQYGYPNGGYAGPSLGFRCNVAYNGVVAWVRVGRSY